MASVLDRYQEACTSGQKGRVKLTDTGAAARWAKVTRITEGITDHGIGKAVRAYFLLYLPVGVILLTSIGFLLSVLIFGDIGEQWSMHLAMGLLLTSMSTGVGGFIYARKRVNPQVRPQRSGALIWLDKAEKKSVQKQIYGRIPPVPEHLTVARGAAVQIRQSLALFLLVGPAYPFLALAQLLNTPEGFLTLTWILLLGLYLALYFMAAWQFHQTGRFLKRNVP